MKTFICNCLLPNIPVILCVVFVTLAVCMWLRGEQEFMRNKWKSLKLKLTSSVSTKWEMQVPELAEQEGQIKVKAEAAIHYSSEVVRYLSRTKYKTIAIISVNFTYILNKLLKTLYVKEIH